MKSFVCRREVPRKRIELIPQRLRLNHHALTSHDARLALEWQMIGVFVDRDVYSDARRVAAARNQLLGSECRLDAASTCAVVLLSLMEHANKATLDRLDLFGVFALAGPDLQVATARWAGAIRVVEHVPRFKQRERGLRVRTVARLLAVSVGRRVLGAAPFAAVAKQQSIAHQQLLLELRDFDRELSWLLALELTHSALELQHLLHKHMTQPPVRRGVEWPRSSKMGKKDGHKNDGNYYPVTLRAEADLQAKIRQAIKEDAELDAFMKSLDVPMSVPNPTIGGVDIDDDDDDDSDEAARRIAYRSVFEREEEDDVALN